jgi:hypothetical protein
MQFAIPPFTTLNVIAFGLLTGFGEFPPSVKCNVRGRSNRGLGGMLRKFGSHDWGAELSSKINCGLYYKTITIVIMMIVSDTTIWSVTYDRNLRCQLRLKHRLRLRQSTFIVQASFTIVTYDRQNIFIIQTTG